MAPYLFSSFPLFFLLDLHPLIHALRSASPFSPILYFVPFVSLCFILFSSLIRFFSFFKTNTNKSFLPFVTNQAGSP